MTDTLSACYDVAVTSCHRRASEGTGTGAADSRPAAAATPVVVDGLLDAAGPLWPEQGVALDRLFRSRLRAVGAGLRGLAGGAVRSRLVSCVGHLSTEITEPSKSSRTGRSSASERGARFRVPQSSCSVVSDCAVTPPLTPTGNTKHHMRAWCSMSSLNLVRAWAVSVGRVSAMAAR